MKKLIFVMEVISAIFLCAVLLLMTSNIIIRTITGIPIKGTFEMVGLLAMVFAGTAVIICAAEKGHIVVDILTSHLPKVPNTVVLYFAHIFEIVYFALLGWSGWVLASSKFIAGEVTETLKIPVAPFRAYWVICAVVAIAIKIYQTIKINKTCNENAEIKLEEGE